MKTHLLTLAAIAALTTLGLADSPDAILKDYRARAAQATQRLNDTLEKQAAAIITDLIRKGDTAGAETVTTQVKQKISGEPILPPPHVAAAALFAQYDGARATALQPIQKASLTRLDSLLNVPGGAKVADLEAITQARTEIETAKLSKPTTVPLLWTYHRSTGSAIMADLTLNPDGTWKLIDAKSQAKPESGTWKQTGKTTVELEYNGAIWKMEFDKKTGTIDRPDIGKRYLAIKDK